MEQRQEIINKAKEINERINNDEEGWDWKKHELFWALNQLLQSLEVITEHKGKIYDLEGEIKLLKWDLLEKDEQMAKEKQRLLNKLK